MIRPPFSYQASDLLRVLTETTALRRQLLESSRQLIQNLSDLWLDVRRKDIARNVLENHHFNPLRRISIKETDHSRILGDLLDPQGSHGQGMLFLDSFLKMLGIEPLGGQWTVTVPSEQVDILLRRRNPASVVIVENKVHNAQDQDGQLYRYWFHQIHSHHPELCYEDRETARHFRVVYLPPGGFASPVERSVTRPQGPDYQSCPRERLPSQILDCRSFRTDVTGWLKTFDQHELSPRLKTFLNLYAEIWSF